MDSIKGIKAEWEKQPEAFPVFLEKHPFHQVECCPGICHQESEWLMKNFFWEKRKEKNEK